MTNEEAIKVLRTESIELGGSAASVCRFWEALDMAISALRQQECVGDVNKSLTLDELSERNAPVFCQSKISRMVGIGVCAKTDTSFLQVDTDLWQKRDQTGCFTARIRRRMTMPDLKPCPICGAKVNVHGPDDWNPTFYDPDSGGDPVSLYCECGISFSIGSYDYQETYRAWNRRSGEEEA